MTLFQDERSKRKKNAKVFSGFGNRFWIIAVSLPNFFIKHLWGFFFPLSLSCSEFFHFILLALHIQILYALLVYIYKSYMHYLMLALSLSLPLSLFHTRTCAHTHTRSFCLSVFQCLVMLLTISSILCTYSFGEISLQVFVFKFSFLIMCIEGALNCAHNYNAYRGYKGVWDLRN